MTMSKIAAPISILFPPLHTPYPHYIMFQPNLLQIIVEDEFLNIGNNFLSIPFYDITYMINDIIAVRIQLVGSYLRDVHFIFFNNYPTH